MTFTSEKETEAEKNIVIKMGVTNASVPFLEVKSVSKKNKTTLTTL